ncbi:MAG: arsenosugar biosynthesis radical SAM protein ArsS [Desulfuromonadia bacterium]
MPSPFDERLRGVDPEYETFLELSTLQVNMGNICNLHCSHCHVDASTTGSDMMSEEVIRGIIGFLSRRPGLTLDITGGCPEMNPHFRFLVEESAAITNRRLLRSNLLIMAEPGYDWLPGFCRDQGLTVIGSLPCYLEENVDRQRGHGVYDKSIQVLKQLNSLGYGRELELDLVYNPAGSYLPGSQRELEEAYRSELFKRHGIVFTHLFTITNAPIGRFRKHLEASGRYREYLRMLADHFNPDTAGSIMCRTLLSVDWKGRLFDCDFNQAAGMPITAENGRVMTLGDLEKVTVRGRKIRLSEHCYSCTAGEGSSCTGALAA